MESDSGAAGGFAGQEDVERRGKEREVANAAVGRLGFSIKGHCAGICQPVRRS